METKSIEHYYNYRSYDIIHMLPKRGRGQVVSNENAEIISLVSQKLSSQSVTSRNSHGIETLRSWQNAYSYCLLIVMLCQTCTCQITPTIDMYWQIIITHRVQPCNREIHIVCQAGNATWSWFGERKAVIRQNASGMLTDRLNSDAISSANVRHAGGPLLLFVTRFTSANSSRNIQSCYSELFLT